MTNHKTAADHLLDCYDNIRQADRTVCGAITSLDDAAQIQHHIVARRVARGETRLGYKIGFTNRTIWARYGVHHPIWGPVYDSTVTELPGHQASISVSRFVQPRLEPEIVVRLQSVPVAAEPVAIAESLQWVAHGFEIVQSHYPDWAFSGPESFAAQGLHGALLIAPPVRPDELAPPTELPGMLAGIGIELFEAGQEECVDQGVGTNVLDGPLHAIAHLMEQLAHYGGELSAGDIITTGTITDAQPLASGQQWRSALTNAGPLSGIVLAVSE